MWLARVKWAFYPLIDGMRHADRHFLLNALSFALIYHCTNWLAAKADVQQHVMLAAERDLPFVAWMILPYSLSLLFFAFPFWLARTQDLPAVRRISQTFLMATCIAGLVFLWWPLRQQHVIPDGGHAYAALYAVLHSVDQPFNQLPSLHVAYAGIGWWFIRPALALRWQRFALDCAALLLLASTLFTYQHHAADVLSGMLLALLCVRWRVNTQQPAVALYYGLAAVWLSSLAFYSGHWWLLYPALSCTLVAIAYQRRNAMFLNKQNGKFHWQQLILYGPYLCSYQISWYLQRFILQPAIRPEQISPQWIIGPRLTASEARALPAGVVVMDCSAELAEQAVLMARVAAGELRYLHHPLLDILQPAEADCDAIINALRPELASGKTIYLHCAMGFHRCRVIAARFKETG
jgi:hypothetical protein